MNTESGPGKVLLIVGAIALAVLVIFLEHNGLPPVSWINAAQASFFGGRYYPKLTFLIILLIGMIPIGIGVAIFKAVQQSQDRPQPRSKRRFRDDEDDKADRPRRPRSPRGEDDELPARRPRHEDRE